jgi:hypothetical protein
MKKNNNKLNKNNKFSKTEIKMGFREVIYSMTEGARYPRRKTWINRM